MVKQDEKKFRISEIIKRIRKGWSRNKLIEWSIEHWGLTKSTAYNYVKEAYDKLAEKSDDVIEKSRVIQVERLEDLLTEALESNDRQTAVKTLDMLNKIFQLYVAKSEVKIDTQNLKFSFGDEGEENTDV